LANRKKANRELAAKARALGYTTIIRTALGHLRCCHPNGSIVHIAAPGSCDPHTARAIEHRLKRAACAAGGAP
jgi:hypothetical protein